MPMDFNKFTDKAQEVLMISQSVMMRFQHTQLDATHMLLAMLEQAEGTVGKVMQEMNVDTIRLADAIKQELNRQPKVQGSNQDARQMQFYMTPAAQRILAELCWSVAERMKDEYIATEHMLLAIIEEGVSSAAKILREFDITREKVEKALISVRGSHRVTEPGAEDQYQALAKYSRDLTQLARDGKLDPVIGRDDEIRRVIEILSRRTKIIQR